MCRTGKRKWTVKVYMGYHIFPCGWNSSGMRWSSIGMNGMLRSDTLKGVKALIKAEAQK